MRLTLQLTFFGFAAAIAIACQAVNPAPSQSPGVWGSSVPTPAPEPVVSQPIVARTSDTITLLPLSPTGAAIGVGYYYETPHCGILSPIDVDGSFWDAVGTGSPSVIFDGLPGTFRLDSANEATFTTTSGEVLHLTRHFGAKEFHFCQ